MSRPKDADPNEDFSKVYTPIKKVDYPVLADWTLLYPKIL